MPLLIVNIETAMKKIGVVVFAVFCLAAVVAEEMQFSIPSDPKAKYFVLEKNTRGSERAIVTKRVGSSGTSFSKRLYNCSNGTVKYLGDGDSLAEMAASKPDSKIGPIVAGSIAYYVGIEACK